MKKNSLFKISLLLLVFTLVVSGCSGGLAKQETPVEEDIPLLMVVDNGPGPMKAPGGKGEMPGINDVVLFTDLASAVDAVESGVSVDDVAVVSSSKKKEEIKAVWISYLELGPMLKDKTEKQFRTSVQTVFGNCKDYGLNTVVVHVRPFGDALYQSEYFPWSYLATGTEGKNPGFDPLEIMVEEAKNKGLRIEAWVNPYRIRPAGNNNALASTNRAKRWIDSGDDSVIQYNGIISYNPASTKARSLIVNGIREIVRNYEVDGVHIDDYFYPTTDAAFDKEYYDSYKADGGTLSQAGWRRNNVEKLIRSIYSGVKAENPDVLFGISPQSSVDNNYSQQYLDVEKIVSKTGYCDYICPQIYFGFENDIQPYAETLAAWDKMIKVDSIDLYVGIAAYKVGGVDSWAGSGSREWTQNTDLLAKMVEEARDTSSYKGFVVYRYDSLFNPESARKSHVAKEADNLKRVM